jgi:hypothetical protein
MKFTFHSERKEEFAPEDFELTDKEWLALSDEEKRKFAKDWAPKDSSYWITDDSEDSDD